MVKDELLEGLRLLGDILHERGLAFELVLVGGGALLLHDVIARPTQDLDAVARIEDGRWHKAKPFPKPLQSAVRDVAVTLGLPREPEHEKDWLNPGPSVLLSVGLPPGFESRTIVHRFGGLTVHLASRVDLIALKMWSATDPKRGHQRDVDIADLRALAPTLDDLRAAIAWCSSKDGRGDFLVNEGQRILKALGVKPEALSNV